MHGGFCGLGCFPQHDRAFGFFAEGGDGGDDEGDDHDRPGEGDGEGAGVVLVGEGLLEDAVARGEQVAELVGETGQDGADRSGAELVEVGGDDAPGTLDHELHEEAADGEHDDGVRPGPEGDHGDGEQRGDDDGAAAAEFFGDRPAAHAAGERADVADGGDQADERGAEAVVAQEGGVEVLGAVAERGEGGHKGDQE